MSVQYEKETGTWFVRWIEKDPNGRKVHRKKRGFPTKKEARTFEEEMEDARSTASFAQLVGFYIESLKGYANDESRDSRRRLLEKYAADLFPKDVRKIKKAEIVRWRSAVVDLDLSVVTKNRILSAVKAVSRFGSDIYDFPDFAKGIKSLPKRSDDVKQATPISPEDFELILQNTKNEVYRRFFEFLYFTGCRRGEAMALLKADVGLKCVSLNKSIRRPKNGARALKTASSKRSIQLTDRAWEAILPLLDTAGEYVFGEYAPLSPSAITWHFERALDASGLPHYRIHDLRHSFVSNAISNGADIVTVSRYVGHSNIQQTLNTYSHLMKDSERKMIEKLNSLNKAGNFSGNFSEKIPPKYA